MRSVRVGGLRRGLRAWSGSDCGCPLGVRAGTTGSVHSFSCAASRNATAAQARICPQWYQHARRMMSRILVRHVAADQHRGRRGGYKTVRVTCLRGRAPLSRCGLCVTCVPIVCYAIGEARGGPVGAESAMPAAVTGIQADEGHTDFPTRVGKGWQDVVRLALLASLGLGPLSGRRERAPFCAPPAPIGPRPHARLTSRRHPRAGLGNRPAC